MDRRIRQVVSELRAMAANPAAAASHAIQLPELVRRLPPDVDALATRAEYQRGISYSLPLLFEDVEPGVEVSARPIRLSLGDVWFRSMTAQAYPDVVLTDPEQGDIAFALGTAYRRAFLPGWRGSFEVSYQLDGRQGFVSGGTSEVFVSAASGTGYVGQPNPIDWRLQRSQVIRASIRFRQDLLPPFLEFPPVEPGAQPLRLVPRLRYVTITLGGLLTSTALDQ